VALAKAVDGDRLSRTARQRAARLAVKEVSEYLGNTPAVCRSSYIDPKVLDRFEHGETVASTLADLGDAPDVNDRKVRQAIETAVIELIADEPDGSAAAA
jgi:DNA topoisomerase IB